MTRQYEFDSVLDVKYGVNPELDAWLLHFMSANHIEYTIEPEKNASPEQMRFMVAMDSDGVYMPCSDWMFHQLSRAELAPGLKAEYLKKWKTLCRLARAYVQDPATRKRILNLSRHKFRQYIAAHILIPSRLMKMLTTIFLTQSGLDDPYRERKKLYNARAHEAVLSPAFDRAVNVCPEAALACHRIADLRRELDMLELARLLRIATLPDIWKAVHLMPPLDTVLSDLDHTEQEFRHLRPILTREVPVKILYLPNLAGGIIFDLMVIRALLRLGHKVTLALKEGFYGQAPTFWDYETDPVLAEYLRGAHFVTEERVSKNELLRLQRENNFLVISDGTRERLNLCRVSVTFARAWKESDLILGKGEANYFRLIQTSHSFTRDIFSFFRDETGHFHALFKPKAPWIIKFSEEALRAKADAIITGMREAKGRGSTVMFYSGIIGSVPGQVKVAIQVMNAFIKHLRSRLEGVYIINPGEHFEEGMDADDLMFMWERVQRSGYLNVWRFQSTDDIEKSFDLMGSKVPPVWAGKDATYSTGCTKEMHIALDVQKRSPELQIIGPSPEKFFRRREYVIGKFFDAAIDV